MNKLLVTQIKCCAAVCALTLGASQAMATEGYFSNGVGARHKGVAGAGVADGRDATVINLNPAGLANVEDSELDISISLFNPNRDVTVTGGPGFLPDGETKSNSPLFPIPNMAIAYKLNEQSTLGFSVSGNGGMNTNFSAVSNPACASPPFPASNGVFCGGKSGVNLIQMFFTAAYAHDFGAVKVGVAPIVAVQRFRARGLMAFGGVTSDPTALSNNGQSLSAGFGARVGIEIEPVQGFRIGGAYQTEMNMSKFDEYAGLFADQGGFDIPSNWQIGVAADVSPQLTLMADYRRINYSDVPSVSNPSSVMLPFGSPGGPGFGWDDVDTYKFGAEYRPNEGTAIRIGYAHNTQPISGSDVTLNVLAPGVSQDHFSAGASFAMGKRNTLELAVMHSPEETVSGIEVTPLGPNPGRTIDIEMNQWEFTVGWKMKL
ncbi:MAG: porin [Sphingomonadaceae bacterium]|nr:porin [Sphingomonadaceae bacterium]